jgi:hypothetical protein
MVELRGILWRKIQEMKQKPKEETEEKMDEEEAKVEEQFIREEEIRLREEKKDLYEFYDSLNRMKMKDMGLDIDKDKIKCTICKKWKDYTKERLLGLIKRNGIDIIWKYTCKDCRKKMTRKRVPEEYLPK